MGNTAWRKRTREGHERDADVSPVSPFLQISLDLCLVWFCGRCFVVCLFLLAFAFGEFCFLSSLIPVVDRQCLALVRQCREKKSTRGAFLRNFSWPTEQAHVTFSSLIVMATRSRGKRLIVLPSFNVKTSIAVLTMTLQRSLIVIQEIGDS